MNKKMNDILDEAHRVYERTVKDSIDRATEEGILKDDHTEGYSVLSRESFINRIKTDTEFSEKWGLKIEERELSEEEGNEIRDIQYFKNNLHQALKGSDTKIDWENIPTKQITITYNNETIESYE
jgi:hypothetical protein